jgi:hypothetical protein
MKTYVFSGLMKGRFAARDIFDATASLEGNVGLCEYGNKNMKYVGAWRCAILVTTVLVMGAVFFRQRHMVAHSRKISTPMPGD